MQLILTVKIFFASLPLEMIMMCRSKLFLTSSFFASLTLSLALLLVVSVPFGHALEIHHIFSEIDHDGHQHADADLCQWVEQHTSNSLAWDIP